jgi:hypothetical protein
MNDTVKTENNSQWEKNFENHIQKINKQNIFIKICITQRKNKHF